MDNDDAPVGRLLTRRETLALLGAGSAALVIGAACGGDNSPGGQQLDHRRDDRRFKGSDNGGSRE